MNGGGYYEANKKITENSIKKAKEKAFSIKFTVIE